MLEMFIFVRAAALCLAVGGQAYGRLANCSFRVLMLKQNLLHKPVLTENVT
jgi:hypothetical protein